jgi:ATP-binding cassette subfamily B protein
VTQLRRFVAAVRSFRQTVVWMMLRRQRRWIVAFMLSSCGTFTVAICTLVTIRDVVDRAIVEQTMPLDLYITNFVLLAFWGFVFGLMQRQTASRIGYQLEYDLRTWLHEKLSSADPKQLDELAGGQLVTRALTDLQMLELLLTIIPILFIAVTLLSAVAVIMLVINLPLGLLALVVLPVNGIIVARIRRRLWALSWATLDRRAQVTTRVDEAVRGIRVVKSFGREEFEASRVRDAAARAYAIVLARVRLVARYHVFLKALPIAVNALLLILAGRFIARHDFTLGDLLVFLAFTQVFSTLAQSFDQIVSIWLLAKAGAGRIFDLVALAEPEGRGGRATSASADAGELRFDDVSVELLGRRAVDRLDFAVEPGRTVAITGGSTSGLSSIAALAVAMLRPTSGTVSLDGVSLVDLDPLSVRRAVRVVSEDPFLFGRTLRENLRIGSGDRDVDDAVLLAALEVAGASSVVDELPLGLDTVLGERGLTLSGGQRQRVALARAVVAPPRVLVLDDALSAVHPALELDILRRVRAHCPKTSVLVLTKRPSIAAIADTHIALADQHDLSEPSTASTTPPPEFEIPSDPKLLKAFLEIPQDGDEPEVSEADVARSDRAPTARNVTAPFARRIAIVGLLLGLFTVIGLMPEGLIAVAVNDFRDHVHGNADKVALIIAVVAGVIAFVEYALRIAVAKISEGVMYLLRRRIFARLSRLGIDYYDREFPGRVAARVVFDLDQVSTFVDQGLYQAATALALLVSAFAVMFVWNSSVALAVIAFLPLLIVLTAVQAPLGYRAYLRVRHRLGDVVTRLQEDVNGRYVIDAFSVRADATNEFNRRARELRSARRWSTSLANIYLQSVEAILLLSTAVLISKAGNLALAGTLSVGSMIALQLYLDKALAPIPLMFAVIQSYLAARASFTTLGEPYAAAVRPDISGSTTPVPHLAGAIHYEGISFTYPETARQVLHDVDVKIEAGSLVAIVGPTGAGKSSLAKLLARIYDPDSGRVLVDGTDLRTLDLRGYRDQLGVVPQDAFCFRGTVAENISYGRPAATRDELRAAVELVSGGPLIDEMRAGLGTTVEEDGRNLTAAQRQVIALARAVLVQPRILVLDEATSSLEGEVEANVLAAIRELDATVLFVTHRLNVAREADSILVVDSGGIVEQGHHDELIALDGVYASLWQSGPEVEGTRVAKRAVRPRARTSAAAKKAPANKKAGPRRSRS